MVNNLEKYPVVRDITQTADDLIIFENKIIEHWENGKIRGPIHLSNGNESQLIEIKRDGGDDKVWCFIGDMSFESGIFYEVHKYARNFGLPLYFVVEDNHVSTNTPTEATWGYVLRDIPEDVIYYNYKSKYPHYGTGKWVVF